MWKLIICAVKQLTIDFVPSTFPLNIPRLSQIGLDWLTVLLMQLLCEVTTKTPKESGQTMRLSLYVDYFRLFLLCLAFV